jgi:thiosulfate/3-mercaptopyruvate sulfurtransferase
MARLTLLCIVAVPVLIQATPQDGRPPGAYPVVDTAAVNARRSDPGWLLVDVRDSNAFNGWALDGEQRGGHIPGAVNVALAWVEQDLKGTRQRLQARGVLGTKPLLLYGTDAAQARRAADLLVRTHAVAAARIHLYSAGFGAWSADPTLPEERLPRYDRLVPAAWLAREMKARPQLRVFEVSWGQGQDARNYERGHIPGAVHLDTDLLESGPLWDLKPPPELARALTALGITAQTPVVLYAVDNMAACWAAVVLMYAGVDDVRVLNGGFPAWVRAGLPVEKGRVRPTPVSDFGAQIPARPHLVSGIDTARQLLAGPNSVLVDVRSWQEFIGEVSGYRDLTAKGRIGGAVWGHGGTSAHHMEDYRNPDNTLRAARDIARFWADWGITPKKHVGFYCGTGWRACEAFFAAWLMGWDNITVYDGGWYEWSADRSNPVASGDPRPPQKQPQRPPRPATTMPAPAAGWTCRAAGSVPETEACPLLWEN